MNSNKYISITVLLVGLSTFLFAQGKGETEELPQCDDAAVVMELENMKVYEQQKNMDYPIELSEEEWKCFANCRWNPESDEWEMMKRDIIDMVD